MFDVIVVGGGVSGCMAAIASARTGANTLLIERYGFLGGTLTNAGVGPMMTFHAGSRQVVTGIPQELIERMSAYGGCIGHIEDTTGYASSVTPFDAEVMKLALDEMTAESGVLTLGTVQEGNSVRFIVQDNGPGISPQDLPHIFDRFYKADKAHTSGMGTGLGLSICRFILQQHGSEINVSSRPGETSFIFQLPLADAPQRAIPADNQNREGISI